MNNSQKIRILKLSHCAEKRERGVRCKKKSKYPFGDLKNFRGKVS